MSNERITDLVRHIARQEILPRFKNLEVDDINAKSPGDLVTIADIEAEKALTAALLNICPQAVVAGEESIAETPDLLDAVIAAEQGFLIDPVDGTNNFVKGDDRFALMLTELRRGQAVAAWIYMPVRDQMIAAEKGAGAYLDGTKITITHRDFDPSTMTGAAHINRFPENLKTIARENLGQFRDNRPAFCAGHDYLALTTGVKDFSVYYRTLPWDHLPGSLIFTEAGGYSRTLTGAGDYTIHDRDQGLLSAADEDQWHHLRDLIFPGCF